MFRTALAALVGAQLGTMGATASLAGDPRVVRSGGWAMAKEGADASRRGSGTPADGASADAAAASSPLPLLGTLVQIHTGECVLLDEARPDDGRFTSLLGDRVTGKEQALDGRLLGLLRRLAAEHPPARVELVSGYRSPKLNEMLRKKGHHVASHSQHSLGHAVDFRVFLPGQPEPRDPREVEAEVRALGWDGGVGVYEGPSDRFVHADVGPKRRWDGQ